VGRPFRFGFRNTSIEPGCDLSHENPRGPGFVSPTLTEWHYQSVDLGATAGTKVEMINNATAGSPCTVAWLLISGHTSYSMPITSPETNGPHYATVTITNAAHRGKWYDLKWRWFSGANSSPFVLVASAAIWVPAYGGAPGSS